MEVIWIILLVHFAVGVSLVLGQWLPLKLPVWWDELDRKPFNCRPCLTFHLSWISLTIVSLCAGQRWMVVASFILALLIFFGVKYLDDKHITK